MMAQLEAMTEGMLTFLTCYVISATLLTLCVARLEERQVRQQFNAEHGAHLPADICLCIENPPTKWEVLPWHGEPVEVLPDIDYDLLVEVGHLSVHS
jgi:autophagy-related protein 17